jgi:hypothetical protein
MRTFLQRRGAAILGVLNGFDRMRFRGTLLRLSSVGGMMHFLSRVGVLLKDFGAYAEAVTKGLRRRVEEAAAAEGRPVQYLERATDKERLVQKIRADQGATERGWIAVFRTLENCISYDIFRNRQTQRIDLRRAQRKCLHYYFYFMDPTFGLTQVRLQTWLPFDVRVVLNGREWLSRQLDAAKIGYVRRDNCFAWIEDFQRAQRLSDRQPRIDWPKHLDRLLRRVDPRHAAWCVSDPQSYYWSIEQSEWATDLAFRSAESLACVYRALLHYGIETFQSPDVMRFLGHKLPAHGGVNGHFAGEVVSDLKHRPEGVRLKHRVGRNSVKMYDKQGTVLRVETTLNDVRGLKVFRTKQDEPDGTRQWLPLRKGVADMSRRAQLSQAANGRYLESLATVEAEIPLKDLAEKLCRPVEEGSRRYRALNPFSPEDAKLLEIVARGEYQMTGLRNRDLRVAWYGVSEDIATRRRQSSAISRKLALLRAHGLIRKIPATHRYLLTKSGTLAIAALLAARNATMSQLNPAA